MAKDKTYSVRWYGPFASVEEVKDFAKQHKSIDFQIYVINGYKKYAKIYDKYYCGQTQRNIYERLSDKDHHIKEYKTIIAIWIGSISSKEPEHEDINVVENIITAQLRSIFGEDRMLNRINTRFQKQNAYILNLWHDTKCKRMRKYPQFSLPAELPDLIGHEYDKEEDAHKLFGASKVSLKDIEWS